MPRERKVKLLSKIRGPLVAVFGVATLGGAGAALTHFTIGFDKVGDALLDVALDVIVPPEKPTASVIEKSETFYTDEQLDACVMETLEELYPKQIARKDARGKLETPVGEIRAPLRYGFSITVEDEPSMDSRIYKVSEERGNIIGDLKVLWINSAYTRTLTVSQPGDESSLTMTLEDIKNGKDSIEAYPSGYSEDPEHYYANRAIRKVARCLTQDEFLEMGGP